MLLMFIYHFCDAFSNYVDEFNKKIHTHLCLVEYDTCLKVK
jgi:hypothetical protein